MPVEPVRGTEGYAAEAAALLRQYESIPFEAVHRAVLPLFPAPPARVLDIGTGRDAAAFAALGHAVVAVEPVAALREAARALHPSPRIDWRDDSLPDLAGLGAESFDLVMLTAVWMHLDAGQRQAAMPRLARGLRPGGRLVLSLRHGPVPPGRRMFAVTAGETIALAEAAGLATLLRLDRRPGAQARPGIAWTRLAFARPEG
jgi:SAM-dependent methyltransferase